MQKKTEYHQHKADG